MRIIARMYDSYETASRVVTELEAAGVPHDELSLIAHAEARDRPATGTTTRTTTSDVTGGGTHPADPADPRDSDSGAGAKRGAVAGTTIGGVVGLLAGIGALAIPGVGPVVAAGWLVATLAGAGTGAVVGAAGGGLIGALTEGGVNADEARVYSEGIRRGGSLVTVKTPDNATNIAQIEAIMDRAGAVNWQQRREQWGTDTYAAEKRVIRPTDERTVDPA